MARTPSHDSIVAGIKRLRAVRLHYGDYQRGVDSGLLSRAAVLASRRKLVTKVRALVGEVSWLDEEG